MASEALELSGKRIWIAGHRGMVGSAIVRRLKGEDCVILTVNRADVDLRRQEQVHSWVSDAKPHLVILAAAKVGGILANDSFPADFLYDNLMIEANVIRSAFAAGVEKLVFLGSSCVYPKLAPQPLHESALLTGPLEPTNEAYAIAKIAGIKLCQAYRKQHNVDFISAMPTNLYGPGDNYDSASSHVLPALIQKAHRAKMEGAASFAIWGTGTPLREFLHVNDCASAILTLAKRYSAAQPVNIGSGEEISILALSKLVAEVVGYHGDIVCDASKPDGTPRKLLDSSVLRALGWRPEIDLRSGIAQAYAEFLSARDRDAR